MKKIQTNSQTQEFHKFLRENGSVTTTEIKEKGFKNFGSIIQNLREQGVPIQTERLSSGVYKYTLLSQTEKSKSERKRNDSYGRIIEFLQTHDIASKEDILNLGCKNPSQAVGYLKSVKGYDISTVFIDGRANYKLNNETSETVTIKTDSISKEHIENELKRFAPQDMIVKTTMKQAVLEHLERHGSINRFEANDLYGCTTLPTIIFCLRKDGYKIELSDKKSNKEQGVKVDRVFTCGTYTLKSKPVAVNLSEPRVEKYIVIYEDYEADEIKVLFKPFGDKKEAEMALQKTFGTFLLNYDNSYDISYIDYSIYKIKKSLFGNKTYQKVWQLKILKFEE